MPMKSRAKGELTWPLSSCLYPRVACPTASDVGICITVLTFLLTVLHILPMDLLCLMPPKALHT